MRSFARRRVFGSRRAPTNDSLWRPRWSSPRFSQLSAPGVRLRKQLERKNVGRSHDGEVPAVQGGDLARAQALGDGYHCGVDGSESEIGVGLYELSGAFEVDVANMFDGELSRDEASQELGFHARPGSCREQVGHLRDHKVRNDERLADRFEPGDALAMVWIIAKRSRYQRSSVDEDDRAETNPSASSLSSACLAENPCLA